MSNKTINEAIPIVDTRLADGSRVNMVLSPIAIDGPVITIRKFYDTPIDIDRLIELGSITKEAADFLELLVKCRYNIFVKQHFFMHCLILFPKMSELLQLKIRLNCRSRGLAIL